MALPNVVAVGLFLCSVGIKAEFKFLFPEKYNKTLQVVTKKGVVQGRTNRTNSGRIFYSYRRIPYAQPPLADLRFKAPQPLSRWDGVLDATRDTPGCIQTPIQFSGIIVIGSEDCLYLNVYRPQISSNTVRNLPVMVWFYGGAYLEGNASSYMYGPDFLMERDVIVVTLNYRVGLFGFLSTQDDAIPGNFGMKDQLAGLQWVRDNIIFFGGDPERVTIFGQSAGASSVMYHMASRRSRGLFHRAIAMSGSSLCPWAFRDNYREIAEDLAFALGLDIRNSTRFVRELRRMSVDSLVQAQIKMMVAQSVQVYFKGLMFTPTVEPEGEDAFLTEPTYSTFKRGDVAKVPLIIGTATNEAILTHSLVDLLRPVLFLLDVSPGLVANVFNTSDFRLNREIGKLLIKRYIKGKAVVTAQVQDLLTYANDLLFFIPVLETVRSLYRHIPVYEYIFSYEGPYINDFARKYVGLSRKTVLKGTGHGEEIPLLWKTFNLDNYSPTDSVVSSRWTKLMENFATTGTPTPVKDPMLGNVMWPPVRNFNKITYLQIDTNLSVAWNYRKADIKFWLEDILDKYSVIF